MLSDNLRLRCAIPLSLFWPPSIDSLDSLLDWGTDNPLQATHPHTHLANYAFDEIAQIVFYMDRLNENST